MYRVILPLVIMHGKTVHMSPTPDVELEAVGRVLPQSFGKNQTISG